MGNQKRSIRLLERHEELVHLFALAADMMRMNLHCGQQCLPVNVVPSIAFTWLANNGERAYSSVRRKQMGRLLWTTAKTAVGMLAGHYRINRSGAMIRPCAEVKKRTVLTSVCCRDPS